jgi:UDP-glucose 4-epimerase
MNAVVFGGAGFIGSQLCASLAAAGGRVRCCDRLPGPALPGIESWRADFTAAPVAELEALVEGAEAVFHLVGTAEPATAGEAVDQEIEIASGRLLEACRRQRVAVSVLLSSGGTVYGRPESLPIPEAHPLRPCCAYGRHKLALERLFQQSGMPTVILRAANVYGPGQRPFRTQGVIASFLAAARLGKPLEIWGGGLVVRDYLFVADLVLALQAAARMPVAPGSVFNVGTGRGVSLLELVRLLEDCLGQPLARRHLDGRACDLPANVLDSSLAHAQLGWRSSVSLEAGLRCLAGPPGVLAKGKT